MGSSFPRKRVYQCSHWRASAYVGGPNLLTWYGIYHGASARQVAFRQQIRRQQLTHLLDENALEADVVIRVAGQFSMS